MNKKNKILVGCLALLLALSVGYALFSDTITINGTATAKGNFDMIISCDSGISSKIGTAESLGLSKEGGFEKDSCIVDSSKNSATFSVDFLYPSATKYFTFKITNNGTIPAVVDTENGGLVESSRMCLDGADSIDSNNVVNGSIEEEKECFSGGTIGYGLDLITMEIMAFETEEGTITFNIDEFLTSDDKIILQPNQSLYLLVTSEMDETWGNEHGLLLTQSSSFLMTQTANIEFNFEQVTN